MTTNPQPLSEEEIREFHKTTEAWNLAGDNSKLSRELAFKDFKEAMKFVGRVSDLAEGANHHPDIHVFYNKVLLELSTHQLGTLSEADFLLAAKIDQLILKK